MHTTADHPATRFMTSTLPDMAANFRLLSEVISRTTGMTKGQLRHRSLWGAIAEVWKIRRFYRWLERLMAREWETLPYELREQGRGPAETVYDAEQHLKDMTVREIVALTILNGWSFISLYYSVRESVRVFKVVAQKLAEQDKRAMEAWDRAIAHRPSFAESVKIGPDNYDRDKTVEVDWATFRPHGS